MKTFLAFVLFAAAAAFGQVSIGIRIGAPPPLRIEHHRPPPPGPGFFFVEGYWYAAGHSYKWHPGYWTRPPYEGARWIAPRHDGERFYAGYWDGDHGRREHDHAFDKHRERDYHDHDRH
jgi:hypothetical protein